MNRNLCPSRLIPAIVLVVLAGAGGAALVGGAQGSNRPQNCEIPVIELAAGREAAPEIIKPGAKFIWVVEKKPGQEIGDLTWSRLGPFTAAAGQRYIFDPPGAWGADSSPAAPKMTPGDASVKFRNMSGKNPVLFCVEGTGTPPAGPRKWKRHDPKPPRFVDLIVYLSGAGAETDNDTEMPATNKDNAPIKITIDVSDDNLEPFWIGDAFVLDQDAERGKEKTSRRISGLISQDGLVLKELVVSLDVDEGERDDLVEKRTTEQWSFAAHNLPLVEEDVDQGTLQYRVSTVEKDLPPAPDFYLSRADYSYYDLYKTPDKTRTRNKDHFDRTKAAYTLVVTLKPAKK